VKDNYRDSSALLETIEHFTLQWHLTAKCKQACMHCYISESETYDSEINNEMGYEQCIGVIEDYLDTIGKRGSRLRINFTGGDPLLSPHIFDLIRYATERSITVGVMGNPELLNEKNARQLKKVGIESYQLSIDGMEKTHDLLRKKGSFQHTVQALQTIKKVGIKSVVMMTVNKLNVDEIIDVIKLVARLRIHVFDFARLVPIGSGKQMKNQMIHADDYRRLLLRVLEVYKNLYDIGCLTHFGRKDHLWKLLYHEIGLEELDSYDISERSRGCAIGNNLLTILADGTVMSCRRLPVSIGKVPEQSLGDIFVKSPVLIKMRQVNMMRKCGKCDLLKQCRGCPAVAYGAFGDYFANDPKCWKKI